MKHFITPFAIRSRRQLSEMVFHRRVAPPHRIMLHKLILTRIYREYFSVQPYQQSIILSPQEDEH
jgi:hypothetical protein